MVVVKKTLSHWAKRGLDLTDSGFSKLQSKEATFDDNIPKFDLEPEKFFTYKKMILEKVERIQATDTFTYVDNSGSQAVNYSIIKQYSSVLNTDIDMERDDRWPDTDPTFSNQEEADDFTDEQIKASTVGSWIHGSLTENAKTLLQGDEDFFKVTDADGNPFYDGPAYFWKIAEYVDPNNGHLIENVRKELRSLNVKNFGYSVIKMLAEFKNLKQRVAELGGTYDEDDQFLDFWECLKTMKEKQFSQYVKQEKDQFRKKSRSTRDPIEVYMKDFVDKEVAMKTDNEWNVMSQEDAMVMALISALEGNGKSNKNKKDKTKKDPKNDKKKDENPSEEKKEFKYPPWKLKAPKAGEPTTKVVDGKTYHFCRKCRKGEGLWALHKESDHKDFSKKDNKEKKTVTFTTDTKSESKSTGKDKPTIKVSKELISNAKAYLVQYQDFQEGGV